MSDAFKNIDYGAQAQNLIQSGQARDFKLAALDKSRQTRGTIEENVGMLKGALSGKELIQGIAKGVKPYLKQQIAKRGAAATEKAALIFVYIIKE